MRIAILNWSNRRVGGAETYLNTVIPQLLCAGHTVSFWHEIDAPTDRDPIALPPSAPVWSVHALGLEPALAALRAWQPHLLYTHGLLDPATERRTLDVAPAVFFAHNYYGTCVSGEKTFKSPQIRPCNRKFGWPCLVQYYPRRCGGWSPVALVRDFRLQASRLELLSRYKAVVTNSTHMEQEYVRHGLHAVRVFSVRSEVACAVEAAAPRLAIERADGEEWRLLFVGRMDLLKGGRELLHALPQVVRALRRPVHVTFAGEGPDRRTWEQLAVAMCAHEPNLRVGFSGWVSRDTVDRLFAAADLLVLPSLWPEPFALVGLEAGRYGLPVAAFAVGGIPDWLQPGVNGYAANGDPPRASALAEAIIACLKDPKTHARLRHGATRVAAEFNFSEHMGVLLGIFDNVLRAAASWA